MMLLISAMHTRPFHLPTRAKAELALATLPLPPDTALTQVAAASLASQVESPIREVQISEAAKQDSLDTPVRLVVPSIKLDTDIVGVGLNTKGEMDVPSGKTNNVGWYEDGANPGSLGSAVFDAHVFAAFARLRELKEGADIYVFQKSGNKLHFQVTDHKIYPLRAVPLAKLFLAQDTKRLNLITCAGSLTRDHSTYDHRLIVYTTLVEDASE